MANPLVPRGDLDKRKAVVLATVVYEYIATAEPVGSHALTQKYNLGVSSATIRNIMAELEHLGYLIQPHTSAGRIPSDAGYRTYVDELMQPEALAGDDLRRIRDEFRATSRQLGEALEVTTRLLGQLSRNLAIVVSPLRESQAFRHIQLIWLSERSALIVVVTSLGEATQHRFESERPMLPDDLTRLSNTLNERFGGKTLRELRLEEFGETVRATGLPVAVQEAIGEALRAAGSSDDPLVSASGARHLLDQPEFHDLRKLRSILGIIEEQKSLYDLVADAMAPGGPDAASVKIGRELGSREIDECSVVTVPYRIGEEIVGVLAILGPRRMPYARLMALASGTAASLNHHLAHAEIR